MRRAVCVAALSALPFGALAAPSAQAVVCEPLIEEIPRQLDPRCLAYFVMCYGGTTVGRLLHIDVYCVA